MRDYTGLCAVCIVLYGVTGMFTIPSMRGPTRGKLGLIYLLVLLGAVRSRPASCV
jgi:hypothetical protein